MKSLFLVVATAVGLVALGARPARANECNELTYLTFSGPTQMPGMALPAGTYRFTRAGCTTAGESHLLRVSSKDGMHLYGTFVTTPVLRVTPSDKPEVVFAEMPAGTPPAIKEYFYPERLIGDELQYPKHEAAAVANGGEQKIFARSNG